jgi:undecaprenyl-diphosphatase
MTLEQLIQWDQQTTLWLNNLGNSTWDPFWLMLSDIKFWYPAYIILTVFLFKELGWKKGLAVFLSCILMVVCIDQSSNAVKDSVERLRPCYNSWMIAHGIRLPYGLTGHLFGFFSGHSANTFGLASASYLGFRLNNPGHKYRFYGIGIFLWAAFVASSRIMMGAHFLGDIVVGACFGTAVGSAIACLAHYLIVKAKL